MAAEQLRWHRAGRCSAAPRSRPVRNAPTLTSRARVLRVSAMRLRWIGPIGAYLTLTATCLDPGWPAVARAQSAAATQAEAVAYPDLVAAAVEEFERGNWTEAQALFARAHALEPNARTLRGMGVCAFEAKQYVRAVAHLQQALVETRKPLDAAQQEEAKAVIARAEAFIARVTLALVPVDAQVEVDAQPAVLDFDGRILLDPGMHELGVSAAHHATVRRTVEVNPGDQLRIELTLAPDAVQPIPPAAPVAGRAKATSATQAATAVAEPQHASRTFAWLATGASVAFAGAGAALLALAHAGVGAVERACPVGECTRAQIERAIDREHLATLQLGYGAAFALAGACAATAVVLFATERASKSSTEFALGPSGLRVSGTF